MHQLVRGISCWCTWLSLVWALASIIACPSKWHLSILFCSQQLHMRSCKVRLLPPWECLPCGLFWYDSNEQEMTIIHAHPQSQRPAVVLLLLDSITHSYCFQFHMQTYCLRWFIKSILLEGKFAQIMWLCRRSYWMLFLLHKIKK